MRCVRPIPLGSPDQSQDIGRIRSHSGRVGGYHDAQLAGPRRGDGSENVGPQRMTLIAEVAAVVICLAGIALAVGLWLER